MIIRFITKIKIPIPSLPFQKPMHSFVIMKMFQKRFKEKEQKYKPNPETYSA